MKRYFCSRAMVAGLLLLLLPCGCLPNHDTGLTLPWQQPPKVPEAAAPPLKTSLADEEQAQFRLGYARLLLKDHRDAEAAALLDKLRHDDKLAPEAYPMLAEIYERQNRHDDALLAWEKALSLRPGDPQLTARVGRAALVCKRYPQADEIYRQWLAGNPVGSPLYVAGLNNLAFSSLLQKNYEQASQYLDQAISLDPLNQRAKANLFLLARLQQETPAAAAAPELDLPAGWPLPANEEQKESQP